MATSRRVGNYSTSAKAVVRASDQIFDAAMSGKPDFTKISETAMKARSMERRAVTKAEGEVASAGLKAFTDTNLTKMREDTKKDVRDIMRPAKRMAGVVAGLGAISGAALMHKNAKEDKAEREAFKAEQEAITNKTNEMFAQTQQMQTEMMETLKAGLTNTSVTVETPKPTAVDSSTTSTSSSSKPISSGDALDAGSGNAGSGKLYTQQQITQFAQQAGFSPENARIMSAIAMGESRGNAGIDTVQSGLDPGKKNEYSIGLTQINVQAHGDKLSRRGWTAEDLRDPVKNMTIAKEVYDEVGSFKPWSVYTSGKYTSYLK